MSARTGPGAFDVDEFLRRVAEGEMVDVEEAERHARAVFWALGGALDAREVADLAADLPEELDPLVPEAQRRHAEVMRSSEFLSRVARRTGLDAEGAERATAAVLETLAERIAAGEVRDLIRDLPVRLHPPLRRGIAGATAERFLRGLAPDVVHDHSLAGPLCALARTAPIVVTCHGDVRGELGACYRAFGTAVITRAVRRDGKSEFRGATTPDRVSTDLLLIWRSHWATCHGS